MCNPNLKTLAKLFKDFCHWQYKTSSLFAITTKRFPAKMFSSYMARGIDVKSTCYLDASAKRDLSYFSRPSILWKVCFRTGGLAGKIIQGKLFTSETWGVSRSRNFLKTTISSGLVLVKKRIKSPSLQEQWPALMARRDVAGNICFVKFYIVKFSLSLKSKSENRMSVELTIQQGKRRWKGGSVEIFLKELLLFETFIFLKQ